MSNEFNNMAKAAIGLLSNLINNEQFTPPQACVSLEASLFNTSVISAQQFVSLTGACAQIITHQLESDCGCPSFAGDSITCHPCLQG